MNTRAPVEWRISDDLTDYPDAVAEMEARVAGISSGDASEQVWLVQHPPLYTAGTSANDADLLDAHKFPVFRAGRGGEFTYHGPGQRVGYVMLDIDRRGRDIRRFVRDLEEWMIVTLAVFGVDGERRDGRVGIWVDRGRHGGLPGKEDKIAAIGVRLRRWVSFHGVSLNISPDLSHYDGIVPCGISQHGVTSLRELGIDATIEDVDVALRQSFESVFGRPTVTLKPA
jgi:lipoyl(octanoyl) transferase